jgi:hypothetical protein
MVKRQGRDLTVQQNHPSNSTIVDRLLQLATDIDRLGFGPDARILTALAYIILDQGSAATDTVTVALA